MSSASPSTLAELATLLNSLSGVLTSLGALLVIIARFRRRQLSKPSASRSSDADSSESPPERLGSDSAPPTVEKIEQ